MTDRAHHVLQVLLGDAQATGLISAFPFRHGGDIPKRQREGEEGMRRGTYLWCDIDPGVLQFGHQLSSERTSKLGVAISSLWCEDGLGGIEAAAHIPFRWPLESRCQRLVTSSSSLKVDWSYPHLFTRRGHDLISKKARSSES